MTDKITQSAKGQECQIRIPHGLHHDPETVVWCHANGSAAGKGIGMKSASMLGAYGCFHCHDIVDGRRKPPLEWTRDDVRLAFWEGHARSICILIERGIITMERGKVAA